MEGTVGAQDYTLYGKINYLLRTGFFIRHSTIHSFIHSFILAVKSFELVSDRMSHLVMRGCRWDLVLIVHATTANRNCNSKIISMKK